MKALRRVLRDEPVMIGAAVRATLLMVGGFGLGLSGEMIAIIMGTVEAWLALFSRLAVGRKVKASAKTARSGALAEVASLAPDA